MSEDFESDRPGQKREIGLRKGAPQIFDRGRRPERVAESRRRNDEDPLRRRIERDESFHQPDKKTYSQVFHEVENVAERRITDREKLDLWFQRGEVSSR